MPKKPTTIILGKREVDLRYDMEAIVQLNDRGVNIYAMDTYMNFPPTKLRDMVWAGQLHYGDKASTVVEITKLLPTDVRLYGEIAKAIAAAMREALIKDDKK